MHARWWPPLFDLISLLQSVYGVPARGDVRNKRPNAETDSEADPNAYQVESHLFFIPQQSTNAEI